MVFSKSETGKESGTPIELYLFELGSEQFAYTNRETDITFEFITYVGTPVSRSRLVSGVDNRGAQVNITLPGNNEFTRLYIGVIPGELPSITIRQLHTNDPDSQAIFVFQGLVTTVSFTDDAKQSDVICLPITSASKRTIPRHTFQGLCNHSLYDPRCTQIEGDFEETVEVESVSGRIVTIAAGELSTEAAEFWNAGFMQLGSEFRQIVGQAGRVMTIDIPFLVDPTELDVRILPGCDHIIDSDCLLVFQAAGEPSEDGNTINHSGFPYVPQKNPYEGLD